MVIAGENPRARIEPNLSIRKGGLQEFQAKEERTLPRCHWIDLISLQLLSSRWYLEKFYQSGNLRGRELRQTYIARM
jgi:hypothetical protein